MLLTLLLLVPILGIFTISTSMTYDLSPANIKHIKVIALFTSIINLLISVLFFILYLGNAGTPLTLNFVGEFLSLYGTFEKDIKQ